MSRTPIALATLASALALAACNTTTDGNTADTATASSDAAAATPADTAAPAAEPTTAAPPPAAGTNPTVGGAEMLPTRTIVENASQSADHTTLVGAVKAAGLDGTLAGPGPFTVFAPTNAAFTRLAPGTVDTLMQPANKASLVKVLTYHVVPGTLTAAALQQQITAGGGRASLKTVEGQTLTATVENGVVVLTDVSGNKSFVTQADVRQSNGIVHVVNGVLVPKLG